MRLRDRKGHLKSVHGDLSLGNVYVEENEIYGLDPCVAHDDMYVVDELVDPASLIADCYACGYVQDLDEVIGSCSCGESERILLFHLVARSNLIRASVAATATYPPFRKRLPIYVSAVKTVFKQCMYA